MTSRPLDRGLLLHQRLADRLRSEITSGRYKPGGKLPSWRQLAARYDVGISTVRLALEVLRSEGLVQGRQGRQDRIADPLPTAIPDGVAQALRYTIMAGIDHQSRGGIPGALCDVRWLGDRLVVEDRQGRSFAVELRALPPELPP